ncbi:DUF541 domain-containing protein [Patescibacteria group bacterium]|jgi:uncharacterized protein YggE|nr:DUF541 domain-containing protein [Patescibacteria group bacterium]
MEEQSLSLWQSRRVRGAVILALILLSVFLFAQSLIAFKQYGFVGRDVPAMHTISVSGEGEVFAKPDTATFRFTVSEEAQSAATAQNLATEKLNEALAFITAQGINVEEDVRTENYALSPKYEAQPVPCVRRPCPAPNQVIVGYTITETLSVEFDLEELPSQEGTSTENVLGEFVAGLSDIGVANVTGPEFEVGDDDALRAEARALAIAEARASAERLAGELDVELMGIVNFHEQGEPRPMRARGTADKALGLGGGDVAAPQLPRGENRIASQVSVVYEIR